MPERNGAVFRAAILLDVHRRGEFARRGERGIDNGLGLAGGFNHFQVGGSRRGKMRRKGAQSVTVAGGPEKGGLMGIRNKQVCRVPLALVAVGLD